MTNQAKGRLEHMIDMALAHEYSMNKYFCCVERCGSYVPPDNENPSCHPLECVIVGQKVTTYINYEIANILRVGIQWVEGFLDGYAGNAVDSKFMKLDPTHHDLKIYVEGYQDGEMFQDIIAEIEIPYSKPEPF